MGDYYYLICEDCKEKLGLHKRDGWLMKQIVIASIKSKEKKEELQKKLEKDILTEIEHRFKMKHQDVIKMDYDNYRAIILFILKHAEHNLIIHYDAGKMIKDIKKWNDIELKQEDDNEVLDKNLFSKKDVKEISFSDIIK